MIQLVTSPIPYSPYAVMFPESHRNIAGAFKSICDTLVDNDELGAHVDDLQEIAAKLGIFLARQKTEDWYD